MPSFRAQSSIEASISWSEMAIAVPSLRRTISRMM
jgi:hypothetical protein